MFIYNLKYLLRNFFRDRVSSFIKVAGLSLGLAVFLLIYTYVGFEKSYDTYFSNSKNVARLGFKNTNESGQVWNGAFVPVPLAQEIKDNFPEVKSICRVYLDDREASFFYGDLVFESEESYFVDSSFFTVFNVDFILGDKSTALFDPNQAVISETTAKQMFGNENPIGKVIKYRNQTAVTISGVFRDFPKNSSLACEILMSFNTPNYVFSSNLDNWDLIFLRVYMLLPEGADLKQLDAKFTQIASTHKPPASKKAVWQVYLEPIEYIHLQTKVEAGKESGVSQKTLNLLLFVGFFILLIALINHVNISITQILKRSKQLSTEKALGQKPIQLLSRSITESSLVFVISLICALLLLLIFVPIVNSVLDKEIGWQVLDFNFFIKIILLVFISVLLSSAIEVFLITRTNLSNAFSGKSSTSLGNKNIRKVLISFQFFISMVLLFVTLVFYSQTKYIFEKELGMENSNVLVVKGRTVKSWGNKEYKGSAAAFKQELLQIPGISGVTASNVIPGKYAFSDGVALASDPQRTFISNQIIHADEDYINTYNVKQLAGSGFPKKVKGGRRLAIINLKCAKLLGFNTPEEAIGKHIIREFFNTEYEVVGVTEDFQVSNLSSEVMPITFYYEPNENRFFSIKYSSISPFQVSAAVNQAWQNVFKESACRYFFLGTSYKRVYENEYLQVKIYSTCSLIAILIACIGLFGLAFYSILLKTKEIGVRKVNGAKMGNVLKLIYEEYFILLLISATPGLGLAYFVSNSWLQNYYHRIQLGGSFFIIPILIMLFVTAITISFHAMKAASRNPVEALKYE